MSLKKVSECVKRNNKFLITTHINPEGDALGAVLAFAQLVKALGKKAVVINDDALPYGYDFLPGANQIRRYRNNLEVDFDCLVLLDCSDLKRCGGVYKLNKLKKPVLNIDHHISNTKFGDVNFVEPQASSCSEIIYKVFRQMRVPLDKFTAMLLYVGILTDTGSFRYSTTSSFTHQVVAELLKHKVDVTGIYRHLYENKPLKELRVLNKLLETVQRSDAGKIVWFELGRNRAKDKVISFDLNERLLTFARTVKDVEVAAVFREIQGRGWQVKVNLRSQGKVDVNKVAQFFGGGGHKSASSCTLGNRLPEARKKVLAKIREYLR